MKLKHAFYITPALVGMLLVLFVVLADGCGVTVVKTDTLAELKQEVATLHIKQANQDLAMLQMKQEIATLRAELFVCEGTCAIRND